MQRCLVLAAEPDELNRERVALAIEIIPPQFEQFAIAQIYFSLALFHTSLTDC